MAGEPVPALRIEPLPGYAPAIGRLVGMLTYVRGTTLAAVRALGQPDLDHLHDEASNSLGSLLAHIAAVERYYQVLTFEERDLRPEEIDQWSAALDLGDAGRRLLKGHDLEYYLHDLASSRETSLAALARRDDEWLERPLARDPRMNAHWAWFHVAEDEVNHRGQIRWLRARLPRRD
jgi:uncharacterized damage-inducible protein DinB